MRKVLTIWMMLVVGVLLGVNAGVQAATIDWVTEGNPGTTDEWSDESYGGYGPDAICGAVDYEYQISTYEVTAGQYTEFLNAVAATDTYECNRKKEITKTLCRVAEKTNRISYKG